MAGEIRNPVSALRGRLGLMNRPLARVRVGFTPPLAVKPEPVNVRAHHVTHDLGDHAVVPVVRPRPGVVAFIDDLLGRGRGTKSHTMSEAR